MERYGFPVVDRVDQHDPEQAWYWTQTWQVKEAEAEADYAAGRVASFDNGNDFLADLNSDD